MPVVQSYMEDQLRKVSHFLIQEVFVKHITIIQKKGITRGHRTLVCRSPHFYAGEDEAYSWGQLCNQQHALWSSIKPQNVTWGAKRTVKEVWKEPPNPGLQGVDLLLRSNDDLSKNISKPYSLTRFTCPIFSTVSDQINMCVGQTPVYFWL